MTSCTHQGVQLSVMNILHTTKCGATFCTHHKVWSHFLYSPQSVQPHAVLTTRCGATFCTHHKVWSRIPYSPQSVKPHSVLTTNCGATFRTHHKLWSRIPYSPQSVEPHAVLTTKCGATCCTHHKVWSPRSGRHSRNKKRPVCKVFGFCCRGFLCNRRQGREETNQYK